MPGVRYLTSAPVLNRPINFLELYKDCLRNDEWPGEDIEGGTSVRALFKVLKRRGVISEYRWAFSVEPVIDHLLLRGPIVLGTLWSEQMAQMGPSNYAVPGDLAETMDGHAWCAIGANRRKINPDGTRGAVRAVNSWVPKWGDKGRFWITFGNLDKLIKNDGEACVATEVRVAALADFLAIA